MFTYIKLSKQGEQLYKLRVSEVNIIDSQISKI